MVLVSATSWDDSSGRMTSLSAMLAEKGFTCVQTDLKISDCSMNDAQAIMKSFESELSSMIRLAAIPFPPVIIARGAACVVAQTYISSHPASGMILLSPPASNAELVESCKLPTPLTEFNFEPNFPIAIIGSPAEVKHLRKNNRICQSQNVDIISVEDMDESQIFFEIDLWLDKCGM
ncbi:hypothetical protein JR316_0000838 [Psilocybe cubensis]|nr:hypothetical protein JR316_0000838 [Psilocybe cubensis]KAH9486773.1 hypothetical protein JR316_0000838 [Psilocybe cubensis]